MSYIDDSRLAAALKEASQVMSGLSGRVEMSSAELLERARRMASATKSYTGRDPKTATHFIENKAKVVKSKIGTHVDMLKKTASNISQIKDRIKASGDRKIFSPDLREITLSESGDRKLNEYNQQIDNTLKNLTTKAKGSTQIIEKIKKYRDIMGDVEGELREMSYPGKDRKDKMTHHFDRKYAKKVDDNIEELSKNIHNFQPTQEYNDPFDDFEGYESEDDEEGARDWAKYEGFNCKEDLEKYNEIFKEIVGETPEEYMKIQKEIEMGRKRGKMATKNQKEILARRFSFNLDSLQQEGITKKEESESRLVEVLAKMAKEEDGGSVYQDRKFLDKYIDGKLNDTIHTSKTTPKKESGGKKKEEPQGRSIMEQLSDGLKEKISLDGPRGKLALIEDLPKQSKRNSAGKSSKKEKFDYMSELKMNPDPFDIPKPNSKTVKADNSSIDWDIDRVKKLILKERQEHLLKKREAWERNNELWEETIEIDDDKKYRKKYNSYDLPLPNNKPKPSDFITERDKHDKLYRNAVKGRDGVFHKEDLDYEFGVNPLYLSKKEGTEPISLKGYEGVRKKKSFMT